MSKVSRSVAPKTKIGKLVKGVRVEACLLRRRLLGERPMQITRAQQDSIRQWAERNRRVSVVRLFGSRAMGCARRRSDVDLAVTLTGDDPIQVFSYHMAVWPYWNEELSAALQLPVRTSLYNAPEGDNTVKEYCDTCSFVLFKREEDCQ
jgi:predicted nucleotidyltransferase